MELCYGCGVQCMYLVVTMFMMMDGNVYQACGDSDLIYCVGCQVYSDWYLTSCKLAVIPCALVT